MMRMFHFAKRCTKEILREPINLFFGLGFPVALLLLLSLIQANVPVDLFRIEHLTPGITVFGLSFMTLFSATLVSRDRESALLQRLYTTPLTCADYILGYLLPLIPFAMLQSLVCYGVAVVLGLPVTVRILIAVLMIIPVSVFYIGLGLLCGSVLTTKQVGGVCGALLTNLSAWLSGIWFDLELLGSTLGKIAKCLPFLHAVELERALAQGNLTGVYAHLCVILAYAVVTTGCAVLIFRRQMRQ